MSKTSIMLEYLEVALTNLPPEFSGFKIAHISDTHLPKSTVKLEIIASTLEEARPDIIALTGDILNNFIRAEKCDKLANFIGMLTKICKVYFVTGNHELRTESVTYWKTVFKSLGGVPLDDEYILLSRNNAQVALMGVSGNTVYKGDNFKLPKKNGSITRILLAHRPENWEKAVSCVNAPDLTLSGHAHGGQIRIGEQGLFAPGQGVFPRYTSGLYGKGGKWMVVSRGLLRCPFPPRINNDIHIPLINLIGGNINEQNFVL